MNKPLATVMGLAVTSFLASAFAQEITVAELKSKGALVLSSDELKNFLPGKIARYEVPGFSYMVKLERDGSLTGTHTRTPWAGRRMKQFIGDWKLSDEGRWCMTHMMYQNSNMVRVTKCRDIVKLGENYYYVSGDDPGNDKRKAWPVQFSAY